MNDSELKQDPNISLLRPPQVLEMEAEKESLTRNLNNPDIRDKGVIQKQLKKLDRQLTTQAPKEPEGKEKDFLVAEVGRLEDKIKDGMLSNEEMRRNPAGAVGAHMAWEKAKKPSIQRWKNFKLRLNAGTDDPDVANMERLRPLHRPNGFNMDTTQISGKSFFFPPGDVPLHNVMSDEDKEELGIAAKGKK